MSDSSSKNGPTKRLRHLNADQFHGFDRLASTCNCEQTTMLGWTESPSFSLFFPKQVPESRFF